MVEFNTSIEVWVVANVRQMNAHFKGFYLEFGCGFTCFSVSVLSAGPLEDWLSSTVVIGRHGWCVDGWLMDYQIILKPIFSQLLSSDLMPDHSSPWRIGMPSTNVFEIYSPSPKHSDISSWILVDHWTCRIDIKQFPTTSTQKQASLGVIWHMSPSNELRRGWKQRCVSFAGSKPDRSLTRSLDPQLREGKLNIFFQMKFEYKNTKLFYSRIIVEIFETLHAWVAFQKTDNVSWTLKSIPMKLNHLWRFLCRGAKFSPNTWNKSLAQEVHPRWHSSTVWQQILRENRFSIGGNPYDLWIPRFLKHLKHIWKH